MRQEIKLEQFNELTDKQKQKLRDWWQERLSVGDLFAVKGDIEYYHVICTWQDGRILDQFSDFRNKQDCFPLVNIGQCIELLKNRWTDRVNISDSLGKYKVQTISAAVKDHAYIKENIYESVELVDALWETVKEVL